MVLAQCHVTHSILRNLIRASKRVAGCILCACALTASLDRKYFGYLVIDILDVITEKSVLAGAPDPDVALVIYGCAICGVTRHHRCVHLLNYSQYTYFTIIIRI